MRNFILLLFALLISLSSCSQKMTKDEIIDKYVTNCSKKYNYNYQLKEYQKCLDKGLEKDSTIAYLWQQKAMPYFKARKYEVGMEYIDKAVEYDKEWLDYRAFIKCVFAKTYKEAIIDFEKCIKLNGNSYVMDHTYEFYIGLSYLQLNEFEKATILFEKYINELEKELGEEWLHPTGLFYLGISKYEQEKYKEAIIDFNRALKIYPEFSDVKYYKSVCLMYLGENEKSKATFLEYKEDASNGFSINEDNAIYEVYPYQVINK